MKKGMHTFSIEAARQYGLLESVLLTHIFYWIDHNRANSNNFHNGKYWTYNSTKAFADLFSYASEKQIKTALKHLKDMNAIETANFNEKPFDKTLWYTITEKGLSTVLCGSTDSPSRSNRQDTEVQPIPDINNTDIKPDIKHKVSNETLLERFERFWKVYPVKSGKGDARKRWLKLKPSEELTKSMIKAVEIQQHEDRRWLEGYIPNPATWLNQERWEDEPVTTKKQNNNPSKIMNERDVKDDDYADWYNIEIKNK